MKIVPLPSLANPRTVDSHDGAGRPKTACKPVTTSTMHVNRLVSFVK